MSCCPRLAAPCILIIALVLVPPPVTAVTTEYVLALEGPASGGEYSRVSSAGDFNGDGYGDVLLGVPYNDNAGGADAGAVYIHLGGPGLDTVPDLVILGDNPGDRFGSSVACAGDVNGDGYDDFLVGIVGYDSPGTDAGRAELYFGGPVLDDQWDLFFSGEAAGDEFGGSLCGAGDLNGDGGADLAIGAYFNDAGGTSAGRVYVYWGGDLLNNAADVVLTGPRPEDLFAAVAGVGDVNGDGFDDLLVGAPQTGAFASLVGKAHLFYGGTAMDNTADRIVLGGGTERLGNAVAGPGDVNGDGYADLLVGAVTANGTKTDAGESHIVHGGSDMNAVPDLTMSGTVNYSSFGTDVSRAGDLNGDGYPDFVVGAESYTDDGRSDAGAAYVYFGGPGLDATADVVLVGTGQERLGSQVAGAMDLDGDGRDDLLVSSELSPTGRVEVVSIYPYRVLSPNGLEVWETGSAETIRWRGHDVADVHLSVDGGMTWTTLAEGVGGLPENEFHLVVPPVTTDSALIRLVYSGQAATLATSDVSNAVFRIGPAAPAVASRLLMAPGAEGGSDQYSRQVASAGDVNGDGYLDLIVGAPNNSAAGSLAGRAYVYFGGPGSDDVADWVLTGEAADSYFGWSVDGAGDVNGDGFDDLVIGAYKHDGAFTDGGKAYVYYGGSAPDGTPDVTMEGTSTSEYLGFDVSGAGDVNGDGFADVIIAAPNNDIAGANTGVAWVLFGGYAMDGTADMALFGEAVNDQLGWSVAGGFDYNGDGYADVLAGSYSHDTGGSATGRAYMVFGNPTGEDDIDLVFSGESAGEWFGFASAAAGDVNGDGYGDLLIGAKFNDVAGTNAGRAYLFLGGSPWDAVSDLVFTGAAGGDNLGAVVSTAGDVNGDGCDDFLIGAPSHDTIHSNAGRAYLYLGGAGMDNLADHVWSESGGNRYMGKSVAAAGDLTGDGFPDVILGSNTSGGVAHVYDFNRYHVVSPAAGDTWNVGSGRNVSWLGAEPADLWLSVDGGDSYSLLRSRVGGNPVNSMALTVPHQPTRFARLRVAPHDLGVTGAAESDSLFTIEASVALLALKAGLEEGGGVLLNWNTDPGPEDLAGYRLERRRGAEGNWTMLDALVRDTSYRDASGGPGMSYRLSCVNGLGEALLLGEVAVTPRAALAAWPLPYRGGNLSLSFATAGGRGGGEAPVTVGIYDPSGRLLRRVVDGGFGAGYQTTTWDGRDGAGRTVSSGVYFVRVVSGGEVAHMKLVVVR